MAPEATSEADRGLTATAWTPRSVSCAGVAPHSCPTNGNLVIVPSALEATSSPGILEWVQWPPGHRAIRRDTTLKYARSQRYWQDTF